MVDYWVSGVYLCFPFAKYRDRAVFQDAFQQEASILRKIIRAEPTGISMKKKPDLLLLLFIIFGLGIAVNAVGQALGF